MVSVHIGPKWFFGVDAGLEALAAFVSFLVVLAALRVFFFTKARKNWYFTIAFMLLTLSFLSRAVTDFLIEQLVWKLSDNIIATTFFYGYVAHIFLALTAYIILFSITLRTQDWRIPVVLTLMTIPAVLLSGSYYFILYGLSTIFLLFITGAYFMNYRKKCTVSSCMVFVAFLMLTIAQVFFLFEKFQSSWYVAAQITQAGAYLSLLVALLSVTFKRKR